MKHSGAMSNENKQPALYKSSTTHKNTKVPVDTKPLCCENSCFWFVRLVLSVSSIALTYYFAYEFISDTKLRFGLFVH